ncbi:hypothetical protein KA005_30545, partial [bacterium]|nr:hypothetical protein [bacterium]
AGITSDIGKLRSIVTQKSEPWRVPTLLNSWVNSGGGRTDTLYYKDKTGAVHIVGSIKGGTVGSPIFTLPVGYRPLKTQYIPASDDVGALYLDVDSSGNVTLPFGSSTFVYFSGAIRAEQ